MNLVTKLFPGTGESRCKTPTFVRVAFNNVPITPGEAWRFVRQHFPDRQIRITFSNRKPRKRWGTAWPKEQRATIYRHSVAVFLHELAHLTSPGVPGHNPPFARELDRLFKLWRDNENSPANQQQDGLLQGHAHVHGDLHPAGT